MWYIQFTAMKESSQYVADPPDLDDTNILRFLRHRMHYLWPGSKLHRSASGAYYHGDWRSVPRDSVFGRERGLILEKQEAGL